jgi:hypothetical protein
MAEKEIVSLEILIYRKMMHKIKQLELLFFYKLFPFVNYPSIKVFKKHGLRPLRIIEVPVEKLNIIRPVLCNEVDSNRIETMAWFDIYFKDGWELEKSMHFKLLDDFFGKPFGKKQIMERLQELDYYKMHAYLRQFGGHTRPDEWIVDRIDDFLKLATAIQKKYDYSALGNYIIVLKKPMCKTRYDIDHNLEGYEIYTGHHRAVCARYLNIEKLWVILAKDIATKTPYKRRIDTLLE